VLHSKDQWYEEGSSEGANGFDGVVNLGSRAEVPEASLNNRQNSEANNNLALAA